MAAHSLAEIDLGADVAAALELAIAERTRAVKLLRRLVLARDPKAMASPAEVALIREACAFLASYGEDPAASRRSEVESAYAEWERRRKP